MHLKTEFPFHFTFNSHKMYFSSLFRCSVGWGAGLTKRNVSFIMSECTPLFRAFCLTRKKIESLMTHVGISQLVSCLINLCDPSYSTWTSVTARKSINFPSFFLLLGKFVGIMGKGNGDFLSCSECMRMVKNMKLSRSLSGLVEKFVWKSSRRLAEDDVRFGEDEMSNDGWYLWVTYVE